MTVRMVSKLYNSLMFGSLEDCTLLSILTVPNISKSFISKVNFLFNISQTQSNHSSRFFAGSSALVTGVSSFHIFELREF